MTPGGGVCVLKIGTSPGVLAIRTARAALPGWRPEGVKWLEEVSIEREVALSVVDEAGHRWRWGFGAGGQLR
jgi:hypothetical protein